MEKRLKIAWKITKEFLRYTILFILGSLIIIIKILQITGGDSGSRDDDDRNKMVPVMDSNGRLNYVRNGSPEHYHTLGK